MTEEEHETTEGTAPPPALPAGAVRPARRGRRRSFLPKPEGAPPAGREMTPERRLGEALGQARFGLEFQQRVFLQGMRLDFYCPAARVAVQLDGPRRPRKTRLTEETADQLRNLGILVLRVPEARIESHLREVVAVIRRACEERMGKR